MPVPWDPLMAILVDLLKQHIDAHVVLGRGPILRALQTLPLLCKEARDECRLQPLAPWLLLYQLHVSGYARDHLFDAVPSSIDLEQHLDDCLNSEYESQLPAPLRALHTKRRVRRVQWILHARQTHARAVDRGSSESDVLFCGHPDQWLATKGLPQDIPMCVRKFVGFLRFLGGQIQMSHEAARWETGSILDDCCARRGCTRRASTPCTDTRRTALDGAMAYWELCRTGRPVDDHVDVSGSPFGCETLDFCCRVCRRQTEAEFERIVCPLDTQLLNTVCLVAPPRGRRAARGGLSHGEKQVAVLDLVPPARLLRAARERNGLVRRHLSVRRIPTPHHLPFEAAHVAHLRTELAMALNLDTALLYVATLLNELPVSRRPNRTTPSSRLWRSATSADVTYLKPINAIRKILKAHADETTPLLTSETLQPNWLQKVKDQVMVLF